MIIETIVFYLFACVTIGAGIMVVSSRNPVHSVLFLILAFFNSAGLFVLMGAEFIGLILVIVYVGAVAVLFLFVVMMLDVDYAEFRAGFTRYLPIGAVVGLILVVELVFVLTSGAFDVDLSDVAASPTPAIEETTNTEAIGNLLYTKYAYMFEAVGVILLIAMIGAIVLTHRRREGVHRQRIGTQVDRRREDSIEIKDVKPGEGV